MQSPIPRTEIQKAVDRLTQRFHPQQVILFGSHAYGTPTRDSDVDLLVTIETSLRPVDQAVAIREAVDFPFPTDLLVRTPEQIDERLAMDDPFIREILSKGIILYQAVDRGMARQG